MNSVRINDKFFCREVLTIAPELLGKIIVRKFETGEIKKYRITETEAYRGEEDLACHASKGRTPRTEIMYHSGGHIYSYLIYGIYWMLNIVTSETNFPAAVLIRGIENIKGPGKVGRLLEIDKTFYGEKIGSSQRIWIEDDGYISTFKTAPRIGINYAGEKWATKPWRFIATNTKSYE